ncbi:META domain-containing protein [uncultured Methanolobus sp.]|uniref:META domain-containing protein n=1 Tax=uncultured Methanolobus sp. TaxID=218300 RepID=UPI0029C83CDE|nr:META domain-containing protein [uncultured Methanolobus sp.]
MRNTRKILTLLFICVLATATLLVSGCTETVDDSGDMNNEEMGTEIISINDVANIEWQWSGLIETEPASQSVVPDPQSYTIVFNPDETYSIKADCNVGSGSYTLEGSDLTLLPGPMTLAYCGSDSLDTQYLSLLSNVTTVSMDNDQLVLGIGKNGDRMLFVKEEISSDSNEESETLSFNGTISSLEDGDSYPMFLLESEEISSSGYTEGIKFVISEETVIVDPNGGLFDSENLKEGMNVRVFFGPALTRSIPPIGQAELIQMK